MWSYRPYQNLGQINHNLRSHIFVDVICEPTIDHRARCNKIGGASCNTYGFFHFVSQEEIIASKVILLPFTKLILRANFRGVGGNLPRFWVGM